LGLALLVLCGYAAFAGGATQSPAEPRLQVAICVVTVLAAGAWLWSGSLRLKAPRTAAWGAAALIAFAVWSGLSLEWSAAADNTWTEFNRTFAYVLMLGLAISFGASSRQPLQAVLRALLVLVDVLVVYALGQKLLPGLHIGGLIDLNQTVQYSRLEQPLGYWNALALLLAMGAPAALSLAAHKAATKTTRIVSLVTLQLIVVTIGFTESRGGFIAIVIALAVCVAIGRRRLAMLMWAGVAVLGGVLPLVFGLLCAPLTSDNVPLSSREHAGAWLLLAVVAAVVLLVLAARWLYELEPVTEISQERERGIWRLLATAAGGVVVVGVIAVSAHYGGPGAALRHLWHSFKATGSITVSNPNRLFSAESSNRWGWWVQALRGFWARPLGGWGAGSFPVVDLLFRRDELTAANAHSVPLQWLVETGIVGVALALSAWALLLRSAVATVRGSTADRWAARALVAAVVAYAVHAFYDWDWDIPGVTLPALVLLGVLVGSLSRQSEARASVRASAPVLGAVTVAALPGSRRPGPILRLGALALLVAAICVFAASAVLPSVAASRAAAAGVAASTPTPASLERAEHDAQVAAKLDPLSPSGPIVLSNVADQLNRPRIARSYVLEALRREPDADWQAWNSLATLDVVLGDYRQALTAAQRVLQLNPRLQGAGLVQIETEATAANLGLASPRHSATAPPTPGV
jgi:O-Antigen ligase